MRPGDLAQRPAVGHKRHRAEHPAAVGGDQQLRVGGAPGDVAQLGDVAVVAADERRVRGHAEVREGGKLGGVGMSDLERHVGRRALAGRCVRGRSW